MVKNSWCKNECNFCVTRAENHLFFKISRDKTIKREKRSRSVLDYSIIVIIYINVKLKKNHNECIISRISFNDIK